MGATTKEVGGGASTGLATDFAKWLQSGLASGFGGTSNYAQGNTTPTAGGPNGPFIHPGQNAGEGGLVRPTNWTPNNIGVGGQGNPGGGGFGGNPFEDAISKLLGGGGLLDPHFGTDLSGLKSLGNSGYNFNRTDFSSSRPGAGAVDFSKFDPSILSRLSPYNSDLSSIIRSGNTRGLPGQPDVSVNAGTAQGIDPNSAHFKAVQDITSRQQAYDRAATNARFTQGGGSSLGTPAAYASAELAGRQPAEMAKALGELDLGYRAQNLGERSLGVQAQSAQGQLKSNLYGTLMDALTKGDSTYASNLLTGRGQDVNALINEKSLGLSGMKYGSDQALTIQDQILKQLGLKSGENIADLNAGINNKGLNIDALGKAGGLDLQGQGLNLQSLVSGLGLSSDMIGQLLQYLNSMSQPGIAQRQTVSQPSGWQNAIGAIGGLASAAAPFAGLLNKSGSRGNNQGNGSNVDIFPQNV